MNSTNLIERTPLYRKDDSDVSVSYDPDRGYVCGPVCPLRKEENLAEFATKAELLEHLERHREVGHLVPFDAINRLRAEVGAP